MPNPASQNSAPTADPNATPIWPGVKPEDAERLDASRYEQASAPWYPPTDGDPHFVPVTPVVANSVPVSAVEEPRMGGLHYNLGRLHANGLRELGPMALRMVNGFTQGRHLNRVQRELGRVSSNHPELTLADMHAVAVENVTENEAFSRGRRAALFRRMGHNVRGDFRTARGLAEGAWGATAGLIDFGISRAEEGIGTAVRWGVNLVENTLGRLGDAMQRDGSGHGHFEGVNDAKRSFAQAQQHYGRADTLAVRYSGTSKKQLRNAQHARARRRIAPTTTEQA